MASVNKVILLGRLGQDPELKYTQAGKAVAKFSLATDETWKDKQGEKQQKTTWHTVIAWEKLAEIIGQYLAKGSQVYVEGKIQVRNYETNEGEKRYVTEIVAKDLVMLGDKKDSNGEEKPKAKATPKPKGKDDSEINDDDVPF
jgi:single-strand DNA-binding protein